ncbi:MAG: MBOAT family O-acyltransferase [Crocinitomicaceae bacterium]
MLFNSIDFAIFLPLVFLLYWFVFQKNLKQQNSLIVVASYVFYGWWDWRFLSLILFSTLVDFTVGIGLSKTDEKRKRQILLWTSILVNLGFLGFFKYYNFFLDNFQQVFRLFGSEFRAGSLEIVLPVGISFYTFQTLSYTIDVYKKKLEPTRDFIGFTAYVSFFPQLVAGPIERATNLLPQFYKSRIFDYTKAVDGMRQILWGLFKKVVIADNCAQYSDMIFNNHQDYSGSTLILGAIFFAFQIYGDFSGYSDIAIGTSRLFGFDLKRNFAFPYFSRDIAEFWRRWHISLSTWFRDYLYIPLGGSKGSKWMQLRNTFIIFLVSGFWHGANWTFIAWGLVHALFFVPLLLLNRNRKHLEIVAMDHLFPKFRDLIGIGITFFLVTMAWVFFRAENIQHALEYFSGFTRNPFMLPEVRPMLVFAFLAFFIFIEWLGRGEQFAIAGMGLKWHRSLRWSFYLFLALVCFIFAGQEQEFIYFQF